MTWFLRFATYIFSAPPGAGKHEAALFAEAFAGKDSMSFAILTTASHMLGILLTLETRCLPRRQKTAISMTTRRPVIAESGGPHGSELFHDRNPLRKRSRTQ